MNKQFRVRNPKTGFWLEGLDLDSADYIWNSDKAKAIIFEGSQRHIWEEDDLEIVELSEDERLSRLGEQVAPRLPGF